MSSNKANSSQAKGEPSGSKSDASGSNTEASQKITSFFPVLRGNETRAKMCASKTGDAKQKEILQKLKNKETPKQKTSSAKSDSSVSQKLSVSSALKTPLSQVLRKSIEAAETKKASGDSSSEKPTQRAKKSFQVAESGRALRTSSSGLRSGIKRNVESTPSTSTTTRRRVALSDSGDPKNTFSGRVSACSSPVEDGEHGSSGKMKKNRKRHYRGATYSLFLSKKSKKKNLMKKSKDDECSREGTENSSYLDSEDGNSLMSEDLYTPSEKSLADEEHNADSRTSPMLSSEQKTGEEKPLATDEVKKEQSAMRSENEDVSQNATDMIQKLEEMQWDSESKRDSQSLKAPQYDDISNESFSNSTTYPFKASPTTEDGSKPGAASEGDGSKPEITSAEQDGSKAEVAVDAKDIKDEAVESGKATASEDVPMDSAEPDSPVMDSMGLDNEESLASHPTSGEENENDSMMLDGSGAMNLGRDPTDAASTIATCVKSRQRIKRRFTDDIVDTDVGLLSLNNSMAPPRKALPKPDPPKDVIQTFQSVTRSEAKKGPVPKLECIYNHHQEPVKECTCEGDTYEANLGEEDEGAFCQAVDSIDDKLVGCSNPVVSARLVRPSVKIPFSIMCEMHLWRLKHHHSCPYCGLFCSQGSFLQCSSSNDKGRRVVHLYHEGCQPQEEGIGPFCLHCGATEGVKRVQLEMHMASPPAFHLSQLQPAMPQPHETRARISFSVVAELKKGDSELSALEYRIEDTGKVLSSVGLSSGPEKEELDRLLQLLKEEKLDPQTYPPAGLYDASAEGDVLKVLNILAQGVDPNKKFPDHDSETALHAAAANGHTTIVHLLIQAGAINDALNERIYTPLMLAVESNHKDVAFYLVKNSAVADFKGESGMSSFHIAAKNGNLEILQTLLMAKDVDINSQDDGGWTPIVWASEHDHFGVVKYLLKRGANPNIKDNEGNTGLHWSAFSGSVDICFLYLDYGCDINAVNERGDTPLHIAARQDSLPCVTLFLSRGADVQIKNKSDQIPAECVIDKNGDTYLSLSLNMLLKKIAGKYQHKAEKILLKDISRGKEQVSIQCVNEVDDEPPPLDFLYVTENCETTPTNIDRTITSLQSCHCEDDCSTSNCTCASISYQCWYDKDGLLLPHFNLLDPPMLFECNRACSCWSLNCRNRVLQNGMTCRLQLIRTKGKGWGVRTLKDIPKGTFICEYVGEMISDSAADKRADDSYLFDLDNRDGETYCLDARYYGNISRFINHLCEPNLVPVKVYVDHQDLNFPRIAFFSSRDIKQYEELGFDYCEKFWVIKYKYFTCDCGSPKCKYSKDTIHTTLANYYRRVREEQMLEEGATTLLQNQQPSPSTTLPQEMMTQLLPSS